MSLGAISSANAPTHTFVQPAATPSAADTARNDQATAAAEKKFSEASEKIEPVGGDSDKDDRRVDISA